MFEHHICSQSLRSKVLYSNFVHKHNQYTVMVYSIRFLPFTLLLVALNIVEWQSTLWTQYELNLRSFPHQVVQCTFNIVNTKCLVPKLVSFNLYTIFDLPVHKSLVPAPTYPSMYHIMSGLTYIYWNTCISSIHVFTIITKI